MFFSTFFLHEANAQTFGGRPTQTRMHTGSGAFNQNPNRNWAQQVQMYHNYYGVRPSAYTVYPGFKAKKN
ncbi:MAG: hypothetical protein SFU25_11080, partial [Candidatus Caenarcaniphilales bacterium]|nr:hypothetical protein [Candidatus Caenarcaniphilales bacterium]